MNDTYVMTDIQSGTGRDTISSISCNVLHKEAFILFYLHLCSGQWPKATIIPSVCVKQIVKRTVNV